MHTHEVSADLMSNWAKETGSNVFRIEIMGDARVSETLLIDALCTEAILQIITLEPDHVKAILATQFEEFEKGTRASSLYIPTVADLASKAPCNPNSAALS